MTAQIVVVSNDGYAQPDNAGSVARRIVALEDLAITPPVLNDSLDCRPFTQLTELIGFDLHGGRKYLANADNSDRPPASVRQRIVALAQLALRGLEQKLGDYAADPARAQEVPRNLLAQAEGVLELANEHRNDNVPDFRLDSFISPEIRHNAEATATAVALKQTLGTLAERRQAAKKAAMAAIKTLAKTDVATTLKANSAVVAAFDQIAATLGEAAAERFVGVPSNVVAAMRAALSGTHG